MARAQRLRMNDVTSAKSASARKGAMTKAKAIKTVEKQSALKGRLLSRTMQGAKTNALKREPTLTITGVHNPKLIVIQPKDFDSLELPDYQRGIQPDEVNELLRALKSGGTVADPITLCRRTWVAKDSPLRDKLWIVDGQQRTLAHIEAAMPIQAIVYDCESPEAERQLFVIMNTNRVVSPNNIIAAASNKVATLLRNVDTNPDHPCYRRLMLKKGPGNSANNLGASILLRGLAQAFGAVAASRGLTAQKLLPQLDDKYNYEIADTYLRLIAEVTPTGIENRLRLLPALAIGKVLHEKYMSYGRVISPTKQTMNSLRRTNWLKVTGGVFSTKYLPMVLEEVRNKWKA